MRGYTEIVIDGPIREELRRLAHRMTDQLRLGQALLLREAVEKATFAEDLPGSSPYRIELERPALILIRDEAPWIAKHYPRAFEDLPEPDPGRLYPRGPTDHDIAERLRGETIEDVIVGRSGTATTGNVEIRLEGGRRLEFVLPFGWHFRERPERPSETAVRLAEVQREEATS